MALEKMIAIDDLKQKVRDRALSKPPIDTQPYVDTILKRYGERVVGIFMYGSLLSKVTATATSFPDFFVITDGYHGIFRKKIERLLAYPVPPHIYHLRIDENTRCKYNLVSYRRFKRECSKRASDIYILGRFGKRVALVYARDSQCEQMLLDCCFQAMTNVATRALSGITTPQDASDLTFACLNISYAGETRVEEASKKVPSLFEAEKDFYLSIYPPLLKQITKNKPFVQLRDDHRFYPKDQKLFRCFRLARMRWFLFKSRIRGIMRWPKFLLTVDDWVSILLAKIERTQGIKIKLTPKEKRHPLVYGWKYFFRLWRKGAIGSAKTDPQKKP